MSIDTQAIIAEAFPSSAESATVSNEQPAQIETSTETPVNNEVKEEEYTDSDAASETEESFPKKAVNAIKYRDKKFAKAQSQINELKARLEAFEKQPQVTQPAPKEAPKADNFQSYDEYMQAVLEHKMEEKLQGFEQNQQLTQQQRQQQEWVAKREVEISQQAVEFIKQTPDAQALLTAYAPILDDAPIQIQELFLQSENPSLAFYNLAKAGQIEELIQSSPARAAIMIGRAEAQPAKPQVTKAPTPLTPARGGVNTERNLANLSFEELKKEFNLK